MNVGTMIGREYPSTYDKSLLAMCNFNVVGDIIKRKPTIFTSKLLTSLKTEVILKKDFMSYRPDQERPLS